MTTFDYLVAGLLSADGHLRVDLEPHVDAVADAWLDAAVDVAAVEMYCELLARTAGELEGTASLSVVEAMARELSLPGAVLEIVRRVVREPAGKDVVAALALHLLDICERLALLVYLPELPALTAKADRSGGAARQIGAARHLKG